MLIFILVGIWITYYKIELIMSKHLYFIAIVSIVIRVGFYYLNSFNSIKEFPMFSNPQTDFDELLEGYNMKLI